VWRAVHRKMMYHLAAFVLTLHRQTHTHTHTLSHTHIWTHIGWKKCVWGCTHFSSSISCHVFASLFVSLSHSLTHTHMHIFFLSTIFLFQLVLRYRPGFQFCGYMDLLDYNAQMKHERSIHIIYCYFFLSIWVKFIGAMGNLRECKCMWVRVSVCVCKCVREKLKIILMKFCQNCKIYESSQ